MTTHVFIVNEKSFPVHLRYLFAGTGAAQKETHLSLLADISRVREGDTVIFYLEKVGFFGTFKISGNPFKDTNSPTYLENELGKKLIYRVRLSPLEVMPKCVSEWEALDKLPLYAKDVIWSLIYRKLKGGRGCTPIALHESERLIKMLTEKNEGQILEVTARESLTYNEQTLQIEKHNEVFKYEGSISDAEDVIAEMIRLDSQGRAFEDYLEVFFTRNIGRNTALNPIAGYVSQIIWIGNQVFCGVGMQKIDVFTITSDEKDNKEFNLIELKYKSAYPDVVEQLERYVLWICSYIPGVISSNIQPVLVTKKVTRPFYKNGRPLKAQLQRENTKDALNNFNRTGMAKPTKWFEFNFVNNNINFEEVVYTH
jgi:hypothetical protein